MANFIEKTLEPGEKVIFKGRLHWSYNFRYTAWGILLILLSVAGIMSLGSKSLGISMSCYLNACDGSVSVDSDHLGKDAAEGRGVDCYDHSDSFCDIAVSNVDLVRFKN